MPSNLNLGFEEHKIADLELKEYAKSGDDHEPVTVIIEVSEPYSAIPLRRPHGNVATRHYLKTMGTEKAEDERQTMKLFGELEKVLANFGTRIPVTPLKSSGSFIASVNAQQLRALTRMDSVGIIRPSRTHFVSSGPAYSFRFGAG